MLAITISDFLKPEIIWFLVGLVLIILEFVIPGLVISFFGVGALAVAGVCLVTEISLNVQLLIFIVCSVLSLVLLRKWIKGIFMGHVGATQDARQNLEEFVGHRAVVKERIGPKLAGKVEFHGTNWIAWADEEIAEGTPVEIIQKKNLTFKVKAL